MERKLTKRDSLNLLKEAGLKFGTVLDIGVQWDTPELRELFSDLKHILFEPVSEYHEKIIDNYRGLDFTLEPAAVSDRNGYILLKEVRNDQDGTVSHVTPVEYYEEGVRVVDRHHLDTYMQGKRLEKPYLIKIDVDGHETEIMRGAKNTMRDAACVIVETTLFNLPERVALAEKSGLILWDIVDLTYYDGCLYQVDLIFISDLCMEIPRRLDPRMRMAFEPYNPEAWYSHQADG